MRDTQLGFGFVGIQRMLMEQIHAVKSKELWCLLLHTSFLYKVTDFLSTIFFALANKKQIMAFKNSSKLNYHSM